MIFFPSMYNYIYVIIDEGWGDHVYLPASGKYLGPDLHKMRP